ncbi:rhodanese-like domain-containing protein [Nostoc sp. CCY 9925]|uniref:rhodanese-like domain-containing protein n=1 Tax=Nostoc sp. CCY 9925 TaxID=3103865 RepID=UPI0039C5B58A
MKKQKINPIPLTPTQLQQRQNQLVVLDARSWLEYLFGHIPNAQRFHPRRILNEVSKEQAITVVCLSGHRSTPVAQWLLEQGYQKVYNLQGGLIAWKQTGYRTKFGLQP